MARLHRGGPAPGLPVLDRSTLAALPGRAFALVDELHHGDRLDNRALLCRALSALVAVAARRACGADIPPFGVCHGELHPSAIHIGSRGVRLLDLAMAHNGPGLLDLASWVGASQPPNTHAMGHLIGVYGALAGIPEACTDRGGLPGPVWAPGWQGMHAALWHPAAGGQQSRPRAGGAARHGGGHPPNRVGCGPAGQVAGTTLPRLP
ncbi:phosphotransferase [Micromonosporaceae bacterium B7E4]